MEAIFKALADKNRRSILDRLFIEPGLTYSQLVRDLDMTRQSASRHISILEDAGLIVVHWQGREKLHYLNPVPLTEITDRWLDKFTQQNVRSLLDLKQALEKKEND